ncbi:MAG: RNA-guided endonuclease TnpB family protein [Candidatus Methanomethylicia archaeon]|nr:RNA-guided endonuclease TnpB family protein [Candidatus Methanomethylicia archaeon]
MEVILGVPFGYELNEEIRKLLEDFRCMVNFCIDYAYRRRITSYAKLRKGVYEDWKRRWNYSTHYCHSACKIALAILKNYRKKHKEGKPEAKKLFMQLDPMLYKFYGDKIRVSVKPRKFIFIDLKYGEYQKKFIDAWKEGKLKTGEITINETKIIIPFKKEVDLQNPKDWIAIDINESNITAISSNPHVIRIEHELRANHTTYFNIRRNIQKLAKYKPKTAQRLMKKYSGREKRKTKDLCHKISRIIINFAKQYGFGIIMEDLKGIRKYINKGRILNRRLHSWNFRKLQFYIDYKAKLEGLPVIYVNPKGTSSLCPICGGKLASNGHRQMKCKCGYENDRDIIACLNMLRMRGIPLPLKAINEAEVEMERIVNVNYPTTAIQKE